MSKEKQNKTGKIIHFGSIEEICHLKHAELDPSMQKYKGRIVFGGDLIKDQDGVFAILSEQGAHASRQEAARFVDIVARMEKCTGFNVDAIKAFNQMRLPPECPETWCSLPEHRWDPRWVGKFKNPVVRMRNNLQQWVGRMRDNMTVLSTRMNL